MPPVGKRPNAAGLVSGFGLCGSLQAVANTKVANAATK
jgi:hypothetical protein